MLPFHLAAFLCSFTRNAQTSAHIHAPVISKILFIQRHKGHTVHGPERTHTHMHTVCIQYTDTQGTTISQHPQSIRPRLIPLRGLWFNAAASIGHRPAHSSFSGAFLITFFCFLSPQVSFHHIPFLCTAAITQEKVDTEGEWQESGEMSTEKYFP